MENLGVEDDLWGRHGVVFREKEITMEDAAFKGGFCGAGEVDGEEMEVVLVGDDLYALDFLFLNHADFFLDSK